MAPSGISAQGPSVQQLVLINLAVSHSCSLPIVALLPMSSCHWNFFDLFLSDTTWNCSLNHAAGHRGGYQATP